MHHSHKLFRVLGFFACLSFAVLVGTTNRVDAASSPQPFTQNLKMGQMQMEVKQLQEFLNASGFLVSAAGPGSPGSESVYFGPKTKSALQRFQEFYAQEILAPLHLVKGTGNFFTATRNFVNALLQNIVQTPIPVSTPVAPSIPEETPSVVSAPTPASTPIPETFTVGGTITGFTGTIVLQNNGEDDLTISTAGYGTVPFTFSRALTAGTAYAVTIKEGLTRAECSVSSHGTGVVETKNMDSVLISCDFGGGRVPTYAIGGTVSGLTGTVTLSNGDEDLVDVSDNGSFVFPLRFERGTPYNVFVETQPDGQTCIVTNGSGTILTSAITSVSVSCVTDLVDPVIEFVTENAVLTDGVARVYDDAYTLASTSDSPGAITYETSDADVATVVGSTLTPVGTGFVTVTLLQAASAGFRSASVAAELTVICPEGTTGSHCTVAINQCLENPCAHGSCSRTATIPGHGDLLNDYSCSCEAGMTGRDCNIAIDACAAFPCGDPVHQSCTRTSTYGEGGPLNSYSCSCQPGWFGSSCTSDTPLTTPDITFADIFAYVGDGPLTLAPTSDSAGAFSFLSGDISVATISGDMCTITGPGTVTITANQAEDGLYSSGSQTATLTVYPNACDANPCFHGTCEPNLDSYTCSCDPCFLGAECNIFDTLNCA